MNDLLQWKEHLTAIYFGRKSLKLMQSWCKIHNVEFNDDIAELLMKLLVFSKESINLVYKKQKFLIRKN